MENQRVEKSKKYKDMRDRNLELMKELAKVKAQLNNALTQAEYSCDADTYNKIFEAAYLNQFSKQERVK